MKYYYLGANIPCSELWLAFISNFKTIVDYLTTMVGSEHRLKDSNSKIKNVFLHCTFISIGLFTAGSTSLLATQMYIPLWYLCILGIYSFSPSVDSSVRK